MLAISRLPAWGAMMFVALDLMTKAGTARPLQPPAVRDDIEEVVKLLQQKKVDRAAIAKKVAAIQKKHTLDDLMAVYKPTKRKGFGWDPAKKGRSDGIETHIINLGKKELTKPQLTEGKDLIVRAAYLNLAMVEITKAYTPNKLTRAKLIAGWGGHNGEVQAGSEDALAAVAANDPSALKKAMTRINSGCNGCHAHYRANIEKDLEELVGVLRGPKVNQAKVKGLVAAMEKHHDLDDIMAKVYKPTKLDGIGYDPAMKRPGDGIEKRIIDLGTKKELTEAQLKAEKELVLRVAYYNLAMVEIAKTYTPAKSVGGGKASKKWNQHNDEVGAGSKDVIAAIKANDPKALKKAMGKIGAGCNACHTDFRK